MSDWAWLCMAYGRLGAECEALRQEVMALRKERDELKKAATKSAKKAT